MNLDRAIEVVANRLVADLVDSHAQHEWGNYPEVGENDWDAVLVTASDLVYPPDAEEYKAAYEFLTVRAGGGTEQVRESNEH